MNRMIFENLLQLWSPGTSYTAASKQLVEEHLFEKGSATPRLNQDAKKKLLKLENSTVIVNNVARELADLYHELSKKIHYPDDIKGRGFFCGGNLPLRAALGMAILKLQELVIHKFKDIEVIYCDERYVPKCKLLGGNVSPL